MMDGPVYFSIYGMSGPDAESLSPFIKFIRQADMSLNLFI